MKLSEFKAGNKAVAKLMDGSELSFRYNPRFLTKDNIEAYNSYVTDEGKKEEQILEDTVRFLGAALLWIDLQDEKGVDIPVTVESLTEADLDLFTARDIANAIFLDMGSRANPTPPVEAVSSTG